MADRRGQILCMRPTLIEKSSTVLPPIFVRWPTVVGSSEPSSRVIRSRRSATCRSCSSICFLCVSTVSWASFYTRRTSSVRDAVGVLAGNGIPGSSVRSCIGRQRSMAARRVVAVAAAGEVAVVAVVGDIAGIAVADNPGEVAGTSWWCLSKLFARRFASSLTLAAVLLVLLNCSLFLEQPECHHSGVRNDLNRHALVVPSEPRNRRP